MTIPREEHDANISALEARMDGRVKSIETAVVAIVTTGITTAVAVHQNMSSSMDNMLAAFATGKSMQPGIHVVPHSIAPLHGRQAAAMADGQRGEHNE